MDKKTEAKLQKLLDKYNTLTELLKALSDKDGAEKLQELPELQDKYNTLAQLLVALSSKGGDWNTDKALYEHWEEWVRVEEKEDGTLLAVSEAPEGEDDCSCTITDPELIELINKMRPKPKKSAKKKAEKKVEKKNYKNTTYLDVYRRVVDIMHDKTGFAPSDDIQDEENEVIDICLDFDGWEHRVWQNARTFLGGWTEEDDGDYETQSIFELVDDLYSRYEKLADRWLAEFADHCSILGEVNVEDTSPAGIMKALDKAGL